MAREDDLELNSLPAPRRGDSLGNLKQKRTRVTDGRKTRRSKGLIQFNLKVPKRTRDIFEERYRAALAATSGRLTRGEFLGRLLTGDLDTGSADEKVDKAAELSPADREAGRTEHLSVPVKRDVMEYLERHLQAHPDWTLANAVEGVCAKSQEFEDARDELEHLEQALRQPCPHCGKVGES